MLVTLGRSVERRLIQAYVRRGVGPETVVVFGGIHGDEPKSVYVARQLIALLDSDTQTGQESNWVIVPVVNPDGYERRKRRNANGVDINRNFPTDNWTPTSRRSRMFGGDKPASEPETRAVIKAIEQCVSEPQVSEPDLSEPQAQARGSSTRSRRAGTPGLGSELHDRPRSLRIISIHSINGQRQCNNYDGPARAIATGMRRSNGYPVTKSIGYPTPGSFGTWAGRQRSIPIVTLELPSHHSPKRCWEDNRRAFFC